MKGWGNLPNGTFHQADAFYIFPQYSEKYTFNDIGLLHLNRPVEGVGPLAWNRQKLAPSWIGQQVLYVGYGVSDGIEHTGGGVKRSGSMPLEQYEATVYLSTYQDAGVCFGDSGGPGLLQRDGEWSVIGVNSGVYSENADPCSGYAVHTRVDAYQTWVEGLVLGDQPDCRQDPMLCWCDNACRNDGTCSNDVCRVDSCMTAHRCLDDCQGDARCRGRCFVRATDKAKETLQQITYCYYMQCGYGATEDCKKTQCAGVLGQCVPLKSGDRNCRETWQCLRDCSPTNEDCPLNCYNRATPDASAALDELLACHRDRCGSLPAMSFAFDCGWDQCARELEICFPPANCRPTGGDCPAGQTCFPNPMNRFDCFPTRGLATGDSCELEPAGLLECRDGALCQALVGPPECATVCMNDGDCSEGRTCFAPIWSGIDALGICHCTDIDQDGVCSGVDCKDRNPAIHPDAKELCDGKDNNCDGTADEGCGLPAEDVTDNPEEEPATGEIPLEVREVRGCVPGHGTSSSGVLILLGMVLFGMGCRRWLPRGRRSRGSGGEQPHPGLRAAPPLRGLQVT